MTTYTIGPATLTLPALTGTDKQVAYAESIRAGAISTYLGDLLPRVIDAAKFQAGADKMAGALATKTDAALWIETAKSLEAFESDGRFRRAAELVKAVAAAQ